MARSRRRPAHADIRINAVQMHALRRRLSMNTQNSNDAPVQKMDKAERKEMKARNKAAKLDKASKSLYKNKTFVNKH